MPDLETCWRIFWGLWLLVPCLVYGVALLDKVDRFWPEEYLTLLIFPVSGFCLGDFIQKWPDTPMIGRSPAHVVILLVICLPCFAAILYLSRDDWSVRLSRKLARVFGILFFGGMTLLMGVCVFIPFGIL
ncbi:MAG: hypothetical protein U0903_05850 [Planctomycetales bacterium]